MKHLLISLFLVITICGFRPPAAKVGKIQLIYTPSAAKNPKISEAIQFVDNLFGAGKPDRAVFMKALDKIKDYSYTFESPDSIATWVFETDLKLRIRGYNGGDDTRTLAYVTTEYPNNIFINLSKLDERSSASVAATIVHEIVHSIDRIKTDARFGHSGNSARGKQNSAPYAIGRTARLVIQREITNTKNNNAAQLLSLLNTSSVDDFSIEETEEIDESRVVR
jgi:hypothetical protein